MKSEDQRGRIQIDGRTLAWKKLGSGEPLLLVNGYAATADDWDPGFLQALGGSFEVLCPDNRGVGGSDLGDPDDVSIDSMAADLEALMGEHGIERTMLAGWSMGGFVAQCLAERVPDRISGLALLGTDPGGGQAVSCTGEVWRKLTDRSGTAREQATRLISLLFPPDLAAVIDRDFGDLVAQARAALKPEALTAQERAMGAWKRTPRESERDTAMPVLLAHGGVDVVIPPENLERLAQRFPAARTQLFPGGGHAFMAQEPKRLAASMVDLAG